MLEKILACSMVLRAALQVMPNQAQSTGDQQQSSMKHPDGGACLWGCPGAGGECECGGRAGVRCIAMILWRTLRMAVDTRDSIRAGHAAALTEEHPFGIL